MKKQEKIDALIELRTATKNTLMMGLCGRVYWVYRHRGKLNEAKSDYLYGLIKKENKITKWIGNPAFCWKPGVKRPRIKWINEQIKKLEGK